MKNKCTNCKERKETTRFRKKNWCRDCLCAEQVPIYMEPHRSSIYIEGSGKNSIGFNVAAFGREVSEAMGRKGMKYLNWSQTKEFYGSGK